MSTVLLVAIGIVSALFFATYVGGMYIFRQCEEVDHDRHANVTS